MMGKLSPIALFVYNRPDHTKKTIEALRCNELANLSDLIVFSDSPKNQAAEEQVDHVREYVKTIAGFKSVRIVERNRNLGLAKSIITGVTEVVEEHGRIIVLEDDMVTSPCFLPFMNNALEHYADDGRVISVAAYMYPIEQLPETFFLKGADCWGWATWKRGWDWFEPDGARLMDELKQRNFLSRFDLFGAYDYSGMLQNQIKGINDSWAVRWYASALLNDKLTLYPGTSLVRNIGLDQSGQHCRQDDSLDVVVAKHMPPIGAIEVEEHREALMAISQFLKRARPSLPIRLGNRLRRLLERRAN